MVSPPSTPPSGKKKTVAPETPKRHSGARRWKLRPADPFSKTVVDGEIAFTEHSVIWIGTDEKNDVVLRYPFVSRFHVSIVPQEDKKGSKHCLIDQGSCNGTHVNRKKIEPNTPVPLRNGDLIALAGRPEEPVGVAFAYEIVSSPEACVEGEPEDEANEEERARRAFEEHIAKTFSKARYCNGELKRKGFMDFLRKKRRRTSAQTCNRE